MGEQPNTDINQAADAANVVWDAARAAERRVAAAAAEALDVLRHASEVQERRRMGLTPDDLAAIGQIVADKIKPTTDLADRHERQLGGNGQKGIATLVTELVATQGKVSVAAALSILVSLGAVGVGLFNAVKVVP